ncbi:hypothetical protein Salat_1867100 [Sesamum alatum]|uniref:Uncharacterized protein n=1 Tax=Sesamum alatum TaxID=300844 RepID=A0AAE1Y357_9LAMI|nr:hypothetical protein Salat_1867100 [Sesamum alatum]
MAEDDVELGLKFSLAEDEDSGSETPYRMDNDYEWVTSFGSIILSWGVEDRTRLLTSGRRTTELVKRGPPTNRRDRLRESIEGNNNPRDLLEQNGVAESADLNSNNQAFRDYNRDTRSMENYNER